MLEGSQCEGETHCSSAAMFMIPTVGKRLQKVGWKTCPLGAFGAHAPAGCHVILILSTWSTTELTIIQ